MLTFRGSTLEDGQTIAPNLRKADTDEMAAASGLAPEATVSLSILYSRPCVTVLDEEGPLCIFGASPTADPAIGTAWMVATGRLLSYRRELAELGPVWVDALHAHYPVLTNYVDCRNAVHIGWLRRLGFRFLFVDPHYGAAGIPFIRFIRVTDV